MESRISISVFVWCTALLYTVSVSCNRNGNSGIHQPQDNPSAPEKMAFDSLKAVEYGADAYGMKTYVMAFLKKGPNRNLDSAETARIQNAHLKNIQKMAEADKLVLAGPFLDNGEIRGIYIFNVESLEEARRLTSTDPAIQAGSLDMELRPWYGSAALQDIYDIHNSLAEKSIAN